MRCDKGFKQMKDESLQRLSEKHKTKEKEKEKRIALLYQKVFRLMSLARMHGFS